MGFPGQTAGEQRWEEPQSSTRGYPPSPRRLGAGQPAFQEKGGARRRERRREIAWGKQTALFPNQATSNKRSSQLEEGQRGGHWNKTSAESNSLHTPWGYCKASMLLVKEVVQCLHELCGQTLPPQAETFVCLCDWRLCRLWNTLARRGARQTWPVWSTLV